MSQNLKLQRVKGKYSKTISAKHQPMNEKPWCQNVGSSYYLTIQLSMNGDDVIEACVTHGTNFLETYINRVLRNAHVSTANMQLHISAVK